MEGKRYIEIKTEHEYSEPPEDSGFAHLLKNMLEKDPQLAGLLQELNRSELRKQIITQALIMEGHDWTDLSDLKENPEAARAFGHLVVELGSPLKTDAALKKQYEDEAAEFAKKLS